MPANDLDGADVVLSKGDCPHCGMGPKAYVTYADGHSFCFACRALDHGDPPMPTTPKAAPKLHKRVEPSVSGPFRQITTATQKRYGYGHDATGAHVWTLYDQAGQPVAQKLRYPDTKDFIVRHLDASFPGPSECKLWGQHVWGDQHDKRVVVTEGEIDAMSVAQCADFKYPVVSVNGGAGNALAGLKANYRWLDRFGEIILWFDDDDAGRKALAECAPLFASGKVKVAKIDGFKDANEALQAGKRADIELAIYGATTWVRPGIVNAADAGHLLTDDASVPMWAYPYACLQHDTLGSRRGEVIYHVGGTGAGKSSVINEFMYHWLYGEDHTEEQAKIGVMAFETLLRETQLGILSVAARKRLHIVKIPKADMEALHKQVFGTRRVELFDPETAEWGFESLISYARYLVKARGCNILIIDPLSFIAAQMPEADERRALDKASVILAKLAKELNCSIHIAHHLSRPEGSIGHEDGAKISLKHMRGSGGIAMFANGVIGYERDQQADGDGALVTAIRILKMRWTGITGLCGYVMYDMDTGATSEISSEQAAAVLTGEATSTGGSPFAASEDGY